MRPLPPTIDAFPVFQGGFDFALGGLAQHFYFLLSPGGGPRIALLLAHCLAWPLVRCRPPTVLAMAQNRQKTGKTSLLTPSAKTSRMGP
jgi:hypothetical protein